jgi:hypothetical protein
MTKHSIEKPEDNDSGERLIWGARALAKEIHTTPTKFYNLMRTHAPLRAAVRHAGHRTLVSTSSRMRRALLDAE